MLLGGWREDVARLLPDSFSPGPIAGRVPADLLVQRSDVLAAGLRLEAAVPLSDADAALVPRLWDLRTGDADRRVAARVLADYGDARHAWAGYVDRVEPALDEGTRTLGVIVRVPDPFAPGARWNPRAPDPRPGPAPAPARLEARPGSWASS